MTLKLIPFKFSWENMKINPKMSDFGWKMSAKWVMEVLCCMGTPENVHDSFLYLKQKLRGRKREGKKLGIKLPLGEGKWIILI